MGSTAGYTGGSRFDLWQPALGTFALVPVVRRGADDIVAVQAAEVPGAMAARSLNVHRTCIIKWNNATLALNKTQTCMLSFLLIYECNLKKKNVINKTYTTYLNLSSPCFPCWSCRAGSACGVILLSWCSYSRYA